MKTWKKLTIIFVIGIVIATLGLTAGILWSTIYSYILTTQLPLSPSSLNYELWKETPIPMYLKLYMFNMTNHEDFIAGNGVKPNFVEMGPYVFREVDYKMQQVWNDNGTITYQRKRVWHFDESLSVGSLSDKVTNVNAVTASVGYQLRYKRTFFRDVADRIMKSIGQKLVITKTVNQLLFEGYDDIMLKIARKANMTKIPFDKFGWFYERNNSASYDGTFNMLTGASNVYDVGVLKEWNYDNKVSYYPGTCGEVTGTNGDLWPPLLDNETLSFFVSDICTSMSIKYDNVTTHEGITGWRYTSDETILDNGAKSDAHKCYCVGDCVPPGALNISSCKWGAPAFISLPHFYLADPSYTENIDGMNPSKEKHQLSIAIEPKTGVPLNVNARLQINLLVQNDQVMSMFKKVKTTFVPMLWFAQEANLTPDYAGMVKFVIILQSLGSITCFGVAAIGILIICIGIFLYIRHSLRGEETQVLLATNDNGEITSING